MKRTVLTAAVALIGLGATAYSATASADPIAGAIVGGAAGAAIGGPPGAAVGAILGTIIGSTPPYYAYPRYYAPPPAVVYRPAYGW